MQPYLVIFNFRDAKPQQALEGGATVLIKKYSGISLAPGVIFFRSVESSITLLEQFRAAVTDDDEVYVFKIDIHN